MLRWYTGQPGHGKTLHAIEYALALKAEADKKHADNPAKYPLRPLYVCNVRDFNYAKTGAEELTPERWKSWADSPEYIAERDRIQASRMKREDHEAAMAVLEQQKYATEVINPDFINAIVLIDEAYEHGIFPKRSASTKVPRHVERMAKHRHYGMDIIGVCQSPDTQCDSFLYDVIDRHIHVRRRFGTPWVHLREFDKYEKNPEKAHPLVLRRARLPKKIFGLYKSTELDTTERKIPWYYIALPIMIALALYMMYTTFGSMGSLLGGDEKPVAGEGSEVTPKGSGAQGEAKTEVIKPDMSPAKYASQFLPRVPSQPWSAPVYDDKLTLPMQPPRLFCMAALDGPDVNGVQLPPSCTCLTEQGTRWEMEQSICFFIARRGQYEPYLDEAASGVSGAQDLGDRARAEMAQHNAAAVEGKPSVLGPEVKNVVHAAMP